MGREPVLTMEKVHVAMVLCGSAFARETVAKTILRIPRRARRVDRGHGAAEAGAANARPLFRKRLLRGRPCS